MKFRKIAWTAAVIVSIAALYVGWLAYCAQRNLVTLNVRNMEVREVVKKIERQTWESISVDKGVQGKVTLNVRRKPLDAVLRMIGDQTFSRSSVIFPLYSTGRSLSDLKQALRGEVDPATHGWTNLQSRFPGGGAFGPAMPGAAVPQKQHVSLNIVGKDVAFATLAFSRFAQARVVPEDGTDGSVSLTLKQATVFRAVAQLAEKVNRKWTTLYVLQGGFGSRGPGGPPQVAARDGNVLFGQGRSGLPPFIGDDANNPRARRPGGPEMTEEKREELREQRNKLEEELQQALPSEERQKLEQAQQELAKQFEEMRNMTPEQMGQRFMQMSGANMSQMQRDRLLSSTPEQRARMNQMRGQWRGGPGGPPR